MRKEIIGVILGFFLVFVTGSLLSYHPSDPSLNHIHAVGAVKNLFGPAGAHTAGFLIFLFGLGAFWLPLVVLIGTSHVFRGSSRATLMVSLIGGILLMVATGALLSMYQDHYVLFGKRFYSGGVTGSQLGRVVGRYIGTAGGDVFLFALWLIAFIMTTRVSVVAFTGWLARSARRGAGRTRDAWIIWTERRRKAKRRQEASKKLSRKKDTPIKIVQRTPKPVKLVPPVRQEAFEFMTAGRGFKIPSLKLLEGSESDVRAMDPESLQMQSRLLEKKLSDFDVSGHVVAVSPGPVVTMYEYEPAPGVKINRIVNLADDLALTLRAASVRIVAPIPGKAAVGIEVPNEERETVRLRDVIGSEAFQRSKSKLTLALGKDIAGSAFITDLAKMPHLLIAGATGSGKSVGLNAMICSVLYKATPDEVKMILVDPKRIELSVYDGIPHLIVPVVTEAKKATRGLLWAIKEMERRYALMAEKGVRNIYQYNKKVEAQRERAGTETGSDAIAESEPEKQEEKLPLILIVIDELADLMLVASRDVELSLTRLAQMARAAGIHLLIATQRPSVDVLTGIIKANFPTRISFQVSSRTDSRTILDSNGAENLLGNGDMLFLPPGTSKLQRIHGAFISEPEIRRVIAFLKKQGTPDYQEEILEGGAEGIPGAAEAQYDEKYDEAVALVTETGRASISMIQRRLRVGYNRAARMIEMMERDGVVSAGDGSKPREVLARGYSE